MGLARTITRRSLWVLVSFALLLIGLTFCIGSPAYYIEKLAPAPASRSADILTPAASIIPEHQTEPNTCGYHTLSAIYTAYGLNADALNLRFRLGVDKPVNTLAPDSTGAIHPDIIRVVDQDGFRARILRPSAQGTLATARDHLVAGHPIMTLIRAESGGLHWVAVSEYRDDSKSVRVCDSLVDVPYDRPASVFLTETALSLILIRPD